MKLKSEVFNVVKTWYSDIADLRLKHKLTAVMRDNAGENKSQAFVDFFESVGIKNYFSISHEQWQNGLPEAAVNSIMMISRTVMVESGLGSRFWFKSALAAVEARNATYRGRIGNARIMARFFAIPSIWLQGMGSFQLREKRKLKAYAAAARC